MTAPLPTASRWNTYSRSRYPRLWDGCVGAWCPSLGITGSRLFDYSGRQAWGTLTNTASDTIWSVNGGGLALNLDGSDDYVGGFGTDLAFASGNDRDISMSCWFRSSATVFVLFARALLGAAATRYTLAHDASGFYLACLNVLPGANVSIYATGRTVNDNVWHHAAASIASSGAMRLFVDGTQANIGTGIVGAAQSYSFLIGKFNDSSGGETGNTGCLSGQLDDMRFYSRILNSEEIRMLATRRAIAYEPAYRPAYYTETDAGGGGGASRPYAWQSARLIGAGR